MLKFFQYFKNFKNKKTVYLLILILVVSLIPRLWSLLKNPPFIVDESANIRDINLILDEKADLIAFHWDYSKARIIHLPAVLLIKLGVTDKLAALRYSSVIISLASLVPFFFIAKYFSDLCLAFFSTLLFSFGYYFLEFSRVGWTDVISGLFLGLLLFWVVIKIKNDKKQNPIHFVFAGLIAGLIFYGYRSGIIIITAALITILPKKLIPIKKSIVSLGGTVLYLIVFAIVSLPWIKVISINWEKYNYRLRVVSVKNVNLPYHGLSEKNEIKKYQITKTLDSWLLLKPLELSGTEGPRYLPQGFEIVNWFIKIGFWLGLIIGLFKLNKSYPLYIIYFAGLYGQIITADPPNGARGLIMLPCIYLFFTIFIYKIYKMQKKSKFALGIILFLSIIFSLTDFLFYQYWMSWIKV